MEREHIKAIKQKIKRWERWEISSGCVVVVGVLLEVVLIWIGEPTNCRHKVWESIADLAIAIGVVCEIVFGRKISTETELLSARYRLRAALIEKSYGFRQITSQQRSKLIELLKDHIAATVVRIEYLHNSESHFYANAIAIALREAGMNKFRINANGWPMALPHGVFFVTRNGYDASAILNALGASGIAVQQAEIDLSLPHLQIDGRVPDFYLFVGAKPWPSQLDNIDETSMDDEDVRAYLESLE